MYNNVLLLHLMEKEKPKESKYSDEELVKLSLENIDNFSLLVSRYKKQFFYYLKSFTGFRNDDIEDVIQNSFIKIYKNLKSFNRRLKFSSWAYRIVRNEAIDEIRRQKRQHLPLLPELDIPDNEINLSTELDLKFEKDIVVRTLKKLKDDYREILILRFFEFKDYKEISDILKKPIGTVCVQINRAKKQFKQYYQKYVK